MKTATAPEICNAIMDSFMGYLGTTIRIVCDQVPAFMSHLTQWFLHTYEIHVTKASPVTYGVFMVVFLHARACRRARVRLLMRDIGRRAQLLTSSRRNVVIWCRKEH